MTRQIKPVPGLPASTASAFAEEAADLPPAAVERARRAADAEIAEPPRIFRIRNLAKRVGDRVDKTGVCDRKAALALVHALEELLGEREALIAKCKGRVTIMRRKLASARAMRAKVISVERGEVPDEPMAVMTRQFQAADPYEPA